MHALNNFSILFESADFVKSTKSWWFIDEFSVYNNMLVQKNARNVIWKKTGSFNEWLLQSWRKGLRPTEEVELLNHRPGFQQGKGRFLKLEFENINKFSQFSVDLSLTEVDSSLNVILTGVCTILMQFITILYFYQVLIKRHVPIK